MSFQVLSNTPSVGRIAWSSVHISYDGQSYSVADGNTDKKFVYWKKATPTAFLFSDAHPSLTEDDCIVFLNKNGIPINVLNASALDGDLVVPGTVTSAAIATDAIDSSHIKSDAIVGRHILAGSIVAEKLSVSDLSAISANLGTMTAGNFTLNAEGFIKGGAANFASGTGIWMGNDGGKYKWRVGAPGSSMAEWDGSAFNIYGPDGSLTISSGVVDWNKVSGVNKPENGATRNVFVGAWESGKAYVVGDIVMKDGNGWSCILDHGSTTSNAPPASGNPNAWWQLYSVKGGDGVSYSLLRSESLIVRNDAGNYVTPTITFSAQVAGASGSPAPYAGRFIVMTSYDGVSFVNRYVSGSDESSTTFSLIPDIKSVKVQLYLAGGHETLVDEETVPVVDEAADYDVQIESTNGTVFRVGQGRSTLLIARVFRNGTEITDEIPDSKFKWVRVSLDPQPPPHDDATWNAAYSSGYKQVLVTVDDVNSKATFHCQILK